MALIHMILESPLDDAGLLETVSAILRKHQNDDYYAFERGDLWHVGLGSHATLLIDSKGETATIHTEGKQESHEVHGSLANIAREFVSKNSNHHGKIFGQVGFNYATHIRGHAYKAGKWPLISLMVPQKELVIHRKYIVLIGYDEDGQDTLCNLLRHTALFGPPRFLNIDTMDITGEYKARVAKATFEIAEGKYNKVIVSRAVDLKEKIDMPATLLWGRRGNTPARTFSLNHKGIEATGFSPELVLSLENGKVITEPLAGTRSLLGTAEEELAEYGLSVKEAVTELSGICQPNSVVVEDLMSVRERGSVQHLGSRVSGQLPAEKDGWDVFDMLFPAITASGIPKEAGLQAIHRLETRPRELYSGAVLLLEGTGFFEATLVLRTVFQDKNRSWIQAGAGVIAQSQPERELTETMEKLASVAPYLVAQDFDSTI